jgi:hypothetical protein
MKCPDCQREMTRFPATRIWRCTSCNYSAADLAPPSVQARSADAVNHPPHYQAGGIETIDVIEAWELGFCLGNTVKYISRAGRKGDALEDLKKARWYLDREIQRREREGGG